MTDLFQECVHVSCRNRRARRRDLVDGLDETVLADIDECVGDGFVGTLVNRRDERPGDQERHLTIWETSPNGNDVRGWRYAESIAGGSERLPD